MRRLVTTTCLLFLALAAAARADQVEMTAQAKAANAEFLLRAIPPATPAAICLVDTGVNANPDTAGVTARDSLPGLDGFDKSPTLHGTRMAMLIGGQSNGFGMVGIWPRARVVSMQSNWPDKDEIPLGGWIAGIARCMTSSEIHGTKVAVVALPSAYAPTAREAELLADAVVTARSYGLNVVVAGGDTNGRPIGVPANLAGALSVGSVDALTGSRCASSATGAAIWAPGCSIDAADPATGQPLLRHDGTGPAAAVVAAGLAALRTWRPDLTPEAAERLLGEAATVTPAGRRLDITAAFTAAGLASVAVPPAPPPPPPAPPAEPAPKPRLVTPKLTVRSSGRGAKRTLRIRASNRPPKTTLTVRVYRGKTKLRRIATKTVRSAKLTLRVSRRWTRLTAQFQDPTDARLASRPKTVKARR